MRTHGATVMGGILLCLTACQSGGSAKGTQAGGQAAWLKCTQLSDCAGHADAVSCSGDGYCLDASGARMVAAAAVTGTGGTTHSGGSGALATRDGGSGSGGSSSSTVRGESDAGAASCPNDNASAAVPSPVAVRLFNATANPIYIGPPGTMGLSCRPYLGFTVQIDGVPAQPMLEQCQWTCGVARSGSCGICNAGCAAASVVLVAPGKFYSVDWHGTLFVPKLIPETCRVGSICRNVDTCFVEESRPAGVVTLTAVAGSEPVCGGVACSTSCTPDDAGTCDPLADHVTGTQFTGSVTWSGESVIQIDLK